jgi:uncharacterized protein YndB with AHSA1/START domain/quercetin dioxygenase-like cupin family protein
MAKSGDVLEIPELGIRVRFTKTAAETGGASAEFEVTGRPRGFLTQEHVHATQTERLEPVSGGMKVVMEGREHVLNPGDVHMIPAGTPHTQVPLGASEGTVRITVTPAGRTEAFLEKMATLSRDGRVLKGGWPRPTAAAELIREFGDEGLASKPPAAVQRALATGILSAARAGRAVRERAAAAADSEYVFVDEWDVAAPPQAVFDTLAEGRTYPAWWKPVYIDVEVDGPPGLGRTARQHFKGRLPYDLHTRSTTTRFEPPHILEGEFEGDLRGRGTWTLTPIPGGTHVRFHWQVFADHKIVRALTPVLRPLFRWNHAWAIARAMEGLEPYARGATATAGAAGSAGTPASEPTLPDDTVPAG